jgi:hypothetical protein
VAQGPVPEIGPARLDLRRVGHGHLDGFVRQVQGGHHGGIRRRGPQHHGGVGQVHDVGVRAVQPRVPTAQGDERLVRVGQVRRRRHLGWELRADRVVAALAFLLHPGPAVLVARVDHGGPRHREQHRGGVPGEPLPHRARDPGDVVVADERGRGEGGQQCVVPLDRVRELVAVAVRDAVPDPLPQLVLGQRVHRRVACDRRRVAVDHLAAEPGVREPLPHPRQHPRPERRRHRVRRVESPAVHPAGQPVRHDLHHEVLGGTAVVVERDEDVVALEQSDGHGLPRLPPGPVDGEQVGGGRLRALVRQRTERRVLTADVVEHPVQQHPHAPLVRRGDQGVEVGVVAQARVDAEVVDRVVAVGRAREHRAEQQPVQTEVDDVVEPPGQAVEAVFERTLPHR